MGRRRVIQIVGLGLILLAGWLWSRRLADQDLQARLAKIETGLTEQSAIVQAKVAANDDPVELIRFGRKFLASGNAALALMPLTKATELLPGARDAWYLLGYSYAKLALAINDPRQAKPRADYLDKAKAALQRAHELDPNNPLTNELLKQIAK